MRTLLLLTFCLGLAACTSNPQQLYQEQVVNASTPLAKTPAEALKNASVQPMQIAPGWRPKQWQITPQEPRLLIDGRPSHYRVFSVDLKANKPFQPIPTREQFFKDRVDGRYRPGMAKGCG